MVSIFRLAGEIAINADPANRAIDETTNRARQASTETQSAFSKIGSAALTIGKGIVTAGAALGGAWIAAIEGTREYRTHLAMLDTAFQQSGHSSTVARQTYSELNAVLGDSAQATEAAQMLALVADNEEELATLTNTLTGVYATFGEALPLEGLAEGINHSAKLGEVQGSLADALEWSGITVESFNDRLAACSTEQERQDLIVKTLNDTYAKAGTQYKETNKDVLAANKAQEKLTAAFAELGRVGEPILTAIKNGVSKMVSAAVPKLESFIQKVKDLKKWIKDNENTVDAWVAVIIGATVSIGAFLLVLKWGAIMSAATKAIKGVRAAILLFNAALRANPIGLVVSLLAGLVAAFVYLWNNNKGFRQFWLDMWAKIKSATGTAVKWIKDRFGDLKSALKTVRDTFSKIKDTITDKIDGAREAVRKAIDKIKNLFDFSWSLPKLKVPKITVSAGKAPYGIAGKGKLPSFDVKWNAEGAIFSKPTIFNTAQGLQGVGESGAEAVTPISKLMDYVTTAVRNENAGLGRIMIEQTQLLLDYLKEAMPTGVYLNGTTLVGELIPAIDGRLADRWNHAKRGG